MADYKLGINAIIRTSDMAVIPLDPANRDYQEYLRWVADGHTPAPADPPPPPTQDELDRAAAKAYDRLNALKAMRPAQVKAYIDANVTNLTEAKDVLKTLAVAVSILAREL